MQLRAPKTTAPPWGSSRMGWGRGGIVSMLRMSICLDWGEGGVGHGTPPCFTSWPSSPHILGASGWHRRWGGGCPASMAAWRGQGVARGEWQFQHPQGCTHLASPQRGQALKPSLTRGPRGPEAGSPNLEGGHQRDTLCRTPADPGEVSDRVLPVISLLPASLSGSYGPHGTENKPGLPRLGTLSPHPSRPYRRSGPWTTD